MTSQKPTIFIHIGTPKTGTTSLQTAFKSCEQLLLENKVLYPNAMFFGGHHDLARNIKNAKDSSIISGFFEGITSAYHQKEFNKVVISSEAFFSFAKEEKRIDKSVLSEELLTNIRKLKQAIPGDFDVKIVAYLRRQDLLMEAKYNQRIKYNINFIYSIDEFRKRSLKGFGLDYDFVLGLWASEFGVENMIVRVYEKTQLPEGTVVDFLRNILKIEDEDVIKQINASTTMENPRLSRDLLEYKYILNNIHKDDLLYRNQLYSDILQVNSQMERDDRFGNLFSLEERKAVLDYFSETNKKVAQKYLGREDGRLFMDPISEEGVPPYPGLSVEKAIEISWRLHRIQMNRIENLVEELYGLKTKLQNFPGIRFVFRIHQRIKKIKKTSLIRRIEKSGLFDEDYYKNTYPDVKKIGMDPLQHYLINGWLEGFNPGPHFNTGEYLENHPELYSTGQNPLVHYLLHAKK